MYVFGGQGTEGNFDENEYYEPDSNLWESWPPSSIARHGISVVDLGNPIYVLACGTSPGGSASALNEGFIVLSRLTVDASGDDKVYQEEDSDNDGY